MRRGPTLSIACCCLLVMTLALAVVDAGAAVPKAKLTPSGRAVPPPSAPPAVKEMIQAANHIPHRPYRSRRSLRLRHPLGLLRANP
jgi:hypothetical protein